MSTGITRPEFELETMKRFYTAVFNSWIKQMNLIAYPNSGLSSKRLSLKQAGDALTGVVKAGQRCSVCVKGDWKGVDGQATAFLKSHDLYVAYSVPSHIPLTS